MPAPRPGRPPGTPPYPPPGTASGQAPGRRRGGRNRVAIAGNALPTVNFLVTMVGGIGFVIGKQGFGLPGPLAEDKVVNIPRGGIRDTADILMREGVIDQPSLFIAGAL